MMTTPQKIPARLRGGTSCNQDLNQMPKMSQNHTKPPQCLDSTVCKSPRRKRWWMKFLIKKKTASREATHPPISALSLLSGQTLYYSTALPHCAISMLPHWYGHWYGHWEKYTSANCKWRTLLFYFTEIVQNFAHWAMHCCTFVPLLLLPPLWHLTLKGAVLHWRKQKLLYSATHDGTKFCPTAIVNTGAGGILLWRFSALWSRELGHEIDRDFSIGWNQLMVILKYYDLGLWLSISWLLAKFFNLNIYWTQHCNCRVLISFMQS